MWKYEAIGNDFLILVDWDREERFDAELAAALCDRHRGVGADGLIRLSAPGGGGSLRMDLLNADGSPAETSGNGLRCALLCARDDGLVKPGELLVETAAGVVPAEIDAVQGEDHESTIRVGMGIARVETQHDSPLAGRRAFAVDVGNPHLVLIGETTEGVDLVVLGRELADAFPGGRNVELVAPRAPGDDELDLAVYERGVGVTLACGSGSVAAAAAAHEAGLVGEEVIVHNPGGDLLVELTAKGGGWSATLVGPARRVAEIAVEEDDLVLPPKATAWR
jgi:diaminopimelate epimerase